jgi:hypothetical protein
VISHRHGVTGGNVLIGMRELPLHGRLSAPRGGDSNARCQGESSCRLCTSQLPTSWTYTMTMLRSLRYTILALLLTSPIALGTALTAILNAHERSCYYADVDGVGEKIGQSTPGFIRDGRDSS